MTSLSDYLWQGTRIFLTGWKNRLKPKTYEGDAAEICSRILKDCWNGRFFQTSTTNFPQFWTRDFGWCAHSLTKLKYQKEVHHSIRYALNRFKRHRKITTTITPAGKPFDFPNLAVDSLPWFIHAMQVSKCPYYEHKDFLNREIKKFFKTFIDSKTGLVKFGNFSSMKDFAIRKSSCYDNCMVGLLAKDLKKMKLDNPFSKYDYPDLLKRYFWNGHFFKDDLSKKEYVAGDANLFPFVFGLIADKDMMKSAVSEIRVAKLDRPFPLKYTASRDDGEFIWQEHLMSNYEGDTIWTHMGPLYIKLVKQVDKDYAVELKKKYTQMIEKHKNYLEIFDTDGKPYHTKLYYCDSGMLWAANYLTL